MNSDLLAVSREPSCNSRLVAHSSWLTAILALALSMGARPAHADGLLPGLPYRYLTPPPALRSLNKPPLSGVRVLPADFLRAVETWEVFTNDGQAGASGSKGAIKLDSSATAVTIRLDPVSVPPGLPPQITNDGNAYKLAITEQPSGRPVTLAGSVNVTLRWPHLPVALYVYRSGAWQQVCYSSQAFLTGQTITCHVSQLGTFVAVAPSSGAGSASSSTPTTANPLTRWIPLIAVAAVVILAAIGAFFITRGARR
jgi:hypothetical protein